MKIGHGPATVIGAPHEWPPKVRNVLAPVEADTLREKGCGDEPRYPREAFLLGTRNWGDCEAGELASWECSSRWLRVRCHMRLPHHGLLGSELRKLQAGAW